MRFRFGSGPAVLRSTISRVPRRVARSVRRKPSAVPVSGMVEQFSRGRLVGWVSVPKGAPTVRVELVLDDFVVASTYATISSSMSGVASARRSGKPPAASDATPRPRPPGTMAGPDDDRRNTTDQIQVFSFRLKGIWPYVRRSTRISVRVDGTPLPIHGHGTFLRPPGRGQHTVDDLRAKFAEGYLLDQLGRVSLDRALDADWQRSVMTLHARVRRILHEEFDLAIFLVYGTLLGAVREGGPIRHDGDFDAAYVSRHRDGAAAAAELESVAMSLIGDGLHVECLPRALHIVDLDDPEHRIDLFHCFFDAEGTIAFPFGVAGTSTFTTEDWQGLRTIEFLGEEAAIPVGAERLVAHLYGDDWRRPKPGFNWDIDRTAWAPEAHLSVEQQTRVYWADFYSRNHFDTGSSFSRFVLEHPGTPEWLVDIGCGDGRDACALGAAGRTVLGIDASAEGVAHATARAKELAVDQRVSFVACDVSDRSSLRQHLEELRGRARGPIGFYLRFFLHAIPEHVQEDLLTTIDAVARPGDVLLAEFRTIEDKQVPKTHGKHYRRFLDAARLRDELRERFRFDVDYFVEGRGLSPYGDEDPVLCRVVARRGDG